MQMTLWNGQSVPRVGLGCWAIGGPTANDGPSTNYGAVDDAQSRRALRLGYEMGARVFDTAAGYGAGHSEKLIGEEISGFEDAFIVTKCGYAVDHEKRLNGGELATPEGIRETIEGSRQRLQRDCLDLVLLHINFYEVPKAEIVFDTMAELREEGAISAFGWSTDFADLATPLVDREGFVAIENDYNIFTPAHEIMTLCEDKGLISLNRIPLAMGLLSGKYRPDQAMAKDDVRAQSFDWLRFFQNGKPNAAYLEQLEALRDLLTTGNRTLAQGALSWILASTQIALPVPGFKNEEQVRDNLGSLEKGPLPDDVMAEIAELLEAFRAE